MYIAERAPVCWFGFLATWVNLVACMLLVGIFKELNPKPRKTRFW